MLVLLNPFGGHGAAKQAWINTVQPSLILLGVQFHLIETQFQNHAFELLQNSLQLDAYQGLVLISGDGMLHQVLNGLYGRAGENLETFKSLCLKLPICLVPGGTMNGFSSSLGNPLPINIILKLATNAKPTQTDFYILKTINGKELVDVHCMSAGIVADHDDLVERKFRRLPSFLKLILAPLVVIARAKSYRGKLCLKPSKNQSGRGVSDISKLDNSLEKRGWKVVEDEFMLMTIINTSRASFDLIFVPDALPNDGSIYAMVVRKGVGRLRMIQIFMAFESGKHVDYEQVEIYRIDEAIYIPNDSTAVMSVSGEDLPRGQIEIKAVPKTISFI